MRWHSVHDDSGGARESGLRLPRILAACLAGLMVFGLSLSAQVLWAAQADEEESALQQDQVGQPPAAQPDATAENGGLGVTLADEFDGQDGIRLLNVQPRSPADMAGLVAGDRLLAVDGKAVNTADELVDQIRSKKPGTKVDLEVDSNGNEMTLEAILTTWTAVAGAETNQFQGRYSAGFGPDRQDRNQTTQTGGLGVALVNESDGARGVIILDVKPRSPADMAGLVAGDRLLAIDGNDVNTADQIINQVRSKKPGEKVDLKVDSNGHVMTLEAKLTTRTEIAGAEDQRRFSAGYGPGGQPQFQQFHQYQTEHKSWVGVVLEDTEQGVRVTRLHPQGPAAKAGLREGDLIVKVGNEKMTKAENVAATMKKTEPNTKLDLTIRRDDKEQTISVTTSDAAMFGSGAPQTFRQDGGSGNFGNFGPDANAGFPGHDMLSEQHRQFMDQQQRIENTLRDLRREIEALRNEMKQLHGVAPKTTEPEKRPQPAT